MGGKEMSKFAPNKDQQTAIDALGKNVIVSASAGAGKTATLIDRLMKRILVDGLSVNEICALTFTDAAAGDMKIKLLEALNESYQKEETPQAEKDILSREIALVETADITTIHSFCLTIIKNYGYILNIDPARSDNILDPAQSELYKKKALQITLNDYASKYPEKLDMLLNSLITSPSYLVPLEESITKIAEYLNTKPNIERALEDIKNAYAVTSFNDFPNDVKRAFFKTYALKLTIVRDALDNYMDVSFERYKDGNKLENFTPLKTLQAAVSTLISQAEALDLAFYNDLLSPFNIAIKAAPKSPDLKDDLKSLTNAMNDVIKYYQPLDTMFEVIKAQKNTVHELCYLAVNYLNSFDTIKETENVFDFDDFEKYALKILLHNDGYISKLMQQRYKEIMVDEFQDTNDYQDNIICSISRGNNIFRVGDIKQSIYQFRGAKPSIMQSYLQDQNNQKVIFGFNYRSSDNIVNYNNDLYKKLMSLTENFQYTEDDKVVAGNSKAKVNNPEVKIHLINYETLAEEQRFTATDVHDLRAKVVANQIIEMKEQGRFDYHEMTILVRTHAPKIYLKKAFEEANIPHFIDDRSGFYTSGVIDQVLSWLRFSIHQDDNYLVSILSSPFIGYSMDQIANLKIHGDRLYTSLKALDRETYDLIEDTCLSFRNLDVVSVLTKLYNLNNTYHEKLSIQVKTNLDLLLEKAINFQSTTSASLLGFIRFVENIDDENNSEAVPINDEENVVRVMTWHQSKGLQYPLTILWPTGPVNTKEFTSRVLTDDLFGVTLKDMSTEINQERRSVYRMLAESKQNQEAVEEYLRLLYVATTRAQEKLIIFDVVKEIPTKDVSKFTLYNFRSSTQLFYPVISKHMKRYEDNLEDIEFKKLDVPLTPNTEDLSFLHRFDEVTEATIIQSKPKFEFNKNFVESVSYGNKLHEAVENLPHRTYVDDDFKDVEPRFINKLKSYNNHPFTQELYLANAIENEMPVLYTQGGKTIQGIIDFYAVFDDKLIIVDYKTDAVETDVLIERYTHQLLAYKKALNTVYPKLDILTYIYSFNLDDYIEVRVDAIA